MSERAIVCRVGKKPEIVEIAGFEGCQKIVGGYVQRLRFGDFDILCDEDGGPKGLPFNRTVAHFDIVGDFVVTKLMDEGITPLTEDEAARLVRALSWRSLSVTRHPKSGRVVVHVDGDDYHFESGPAPKLIKVTNSRTLESYSPDRHVNQLKRLRPALWEQIQEAAKESGT